VIPTKDGGLRFLSLLERLARQDIDGGIELLVIDSGSRDGTPEAAQRAGARVERIAPEEFQHGATRNRALALTTSERIALLTQDALPTSDDYLTQLFAALDDARVDGAWARQVPRPDCDPIMRERLRGWPGTSTEPRVATLAPGDPAAARAAFDALPPLERYQRCLFDNVAACVRRSTWERIPFPPLPFGEDVAWARAVLLAGGSLAYRPTAVVEHSHRVALAREFRRIRADHANLCELFGLRLVDSWSAVWRGALGQRRHYARCLAATPNLGPLARAAWNAYAAPYALAETAAQYLGARPRGPG
jgi:rhamnosyltransferase